MIDDSMGTALIAAINAGDYPFLVQNKDAIIDHLISVPETTYAVSLADGLVTLNGAQLVFSLMFWLPVIKRQRPVYTRYAITGSLDPKTIARIHGQMLADLTPQPGADVDGLMEDLFDTINDLYCLISYDLAAYQLSMCIYDIYDSLNHPEVQEVINYSIEQEEKVGISAIETKFKSVYDKTVDVLSSSSIKPNILRPYIRYGCVVPVQLVQVTVAGGCRTDVNDHMITMPIRHSYLDGMRSIIEFAIDSLAAKKNVLYNLIGMPDAQYLNRRIQLMSSSMERIYPGDCGTTVVVPTDIPVKNKDNFVGKFIVDPHTHEMTELTTANINTFEGKLVYMRSPFGCKHTDGFCQVCGGRMTFYADAFHNPGIAAVTESVSPASQLVLSNKHTARTTSVTYILPDRVKPYLRVARNDIYLQDNLPLDGLSVCVPIGCVKRIDDLRYIDDEQMINDHYFSSISHMSLGNLKTEEIAIPEVMMTDRNKSVPFFSADVLRYIKQHPEYVDVTATYLAVDLSAFDRSRPFLKAVVFNDSAKRFADAIETFFEHNLKNYSSIPVVLHDLALLLHRKVSPHILHVETVLRSALITNAYDYRVPIVTDINNVEFKSLTHIIPRRSLGVEFAFERLKNYLGDPMTYVIPSGSTLFDVYAGISRVPRV